MSCSEEETEEKGFRRVEKAVLTGKVAREQEHHGEDDQERDVRLQDPWGERVEEVYEGSGKGDEMRKEIETESLMRNKHGKKERRKTGEGAESEPLGEGVNVVKKREDGRGGDEKYRGRYVERILD